MVRRFAYGALFLLLGACGAADDAGDGDVGGEQGETSPVVVANVVNGTYVIRSAHTNKCVDVSEASTENGARVQEWTCNGTNAQKFEISSVEGKYFKILNVNSHKAIDVKGVSREANAEIIQWQYGGEQNQQFYFVNRGGNDVSIHARHTDMVLDLSWGKADDGTSIVQYPWSDRSNQKWIFDKADGGTTPPPPVTPIARVVGGYYPNWTEAPVRIRDVNSNYNLIYLFAAKPVGGSPGTTGAVFWTPPGDGKGAATNFNADIQYARTVQGRKIILSVGGAGAGMSFPNREKSRAFVDSVVGLYNQFGGFDGLDWNTFEGSQAPDTVEMSWISLELKQRFPGFLITAPPAPWNSIDKTFCAEMVRAGAMDYAAPQYYDGPGLDVQSYIVNNVNEWVALLGPTKVVVGFGIWDQPNYMSVGEAIPTWNQLESLHPTLRGGFNWAIHTDESQGWQFANNLAPLISQ